MRREHAGQEGDRKRLWNTRERLDSFKVLFGLKCTGMLRLKSGVWCFLVVHLSAGSCVFWSFICCCFLPLLTELVGLASPGVVVCGSLPHCAPEDSESGTSATVFLINQAHFLFQGFHHKASWFLLPSFELFNAAFLNLQPKTLSKGK